MKSEVISAIEEHKIIAILRGVPSDKLVDTVKALYEGGIRLLEITYSANGKVSDEETAKNIKILSDYFKGKLYIGAGTVLTEKQVELTKQAGGLFVISPNVCKEVIEKCGECGLVAIPGALTPTEMADANKYGADFVKLFPVTALGTGYIKAVLAPLSHIKVLAVGGIDENNIPEYLSVGVSGFGIGSNIANMKMIENNDWAGIREVAKKYTAVLKNG